MLKLFTFGLIGEIMQTLYHRTQFLIVHFYIKIVIFGLIGEIMQTLHNINGIVNL